MLFINLSQASTNQGNSSTLSHRSLRLCGTFPPQRLTQNQWLTLLLVPWRPKTVNAFALANATATALFRGLSSRNAPKGQSSHRTLPELTGRKKKKLTSDYSICLDNFLHCAVFSSFLQWLHYVPVFRKLEVAGVGKMPSARIYTTLLKCKGTAVLTIR